VTLKRRIRASGSCPAGVFARAGLEVVRRMASHNFRGFHDEIQIKIQSLDSHGCTNDQQIQASLAIRTLSPKTSTRPDTKHARILAMLRTPVPVGNSILLATDIESGDAPALCQRSVA
jgi:hypothetical protein